MSALSDEYIKNFSKERKSIFNKRFRDDYDPNMSERSNIIRILNEMRELGLADGGRIGLKEGLGSFETNDPKEAMKEVIKRFLEKNIETTTVPISENIFLNLGPGVSEVELGGIMKILGGELGFGASKDKGIGFNFKKEFNKGGRVGLFAGAVASGEDISPGTDTKGNVRDDNPFTGGGGGNNNNKPPKKTLTTTQTKDDTKKNVLKTIGGFAFNRFLNSMGVPTKDIQKALAIKGILEQAGNVIFPEGDFQKIKATAPNQKTYNIEATKDLVENNPFGVVGEVFAPVTSLVTSPIYDTIQGVQRGIEDPNKSIFQAVKDENILSSALERTYGATLPLAERISGQKFEKGGLARMLGE
jgi:hypothetical protein